MPLFQQLWWDLNSNRMVRYQVAAPSKFQVGGSSIGALPDILTKKSRPSWAVGVVTPMENVTGAFGSNVRSLYGWVTSDLMWL
jgi:hypothetical protein